MQTLMTELCNEVFKVRWSSKITQDFWLNLGLLLMCLMVNHQSDWEDGKFYTRERICVYVTNNCRCCIIENECAHRVVTLRVCVHF